MSCQNSVRDARIRNCFLLLWEIETRKWILKFCVYNRFHTVFSTRFTIGLIALCDTVWRPMCASLVSGAELYSQISSLEDNAAIVEPPLL